MAKTIKRAFEQGIITLKIDDIIHTKELDKNILVSRKYTQVISSIHAVGLIESPVVACRGNDYILLDGHLRLHALKELGIKEVDCLVSTDDESFTYNKHVNRLSNVQEQKMISKAIDKGVSVERLAKVLDMKPANIRNKKNMLNGICQEAIDLLKDKIVSVKVFEYLTKMTEERQIEAVNLLIDSRNYSTSFIRSIWLASTDDQLVRPRRKKIEADIDFANFGKLEQEINNLHGQYEEIEDGYGLNVLNFTLLKGYLKKVVMNCRVNRYLRINNPDILDQLEGIIDLDSLNSTE